MSNLELIAFYFFIEKKWCQFTRNCWLKSATFCNITQLIPFSNSLTVSIHLNIKLHHTIFTIRIAKVAFLSPQTCTIGTYKAKLPPSMSHRNVLLFFKVVLCKYRYNCRRTTPFWSASILSTIALWEESWSSVRGVCQGLCRDRYRNMCRSPVK
jgi:hypothetical protein